MFSLTAAKDICGLFLPGREAFVFTVSSNTAKIMFQAGAIRSSFFSPLWLCGDMKSSEPHWGFKRPLVIVPLHHCKNLFPALGDKVMGNPWITLFSFTFSTETEEDAGKMPACSSTRFLICLLPKAGWQSVIGKCYEGGSRCWWRWEMHKHLAH